MTVVPFRPDEADASHPSTYVIEMLEELNKLSADGKITAISVAYVVDGSTRCHDAYSEPDSLCKLYTQMRQSLWMTEAFIDEDE